MLALSAELSDESSSESPVEAGGTRGTGFGVTNADGFATVADLILLPVGKKKGGCSMIIGRQGTRH